MGEKASEREELTMSVKKCTARRGADRSGGEERGGVAAVAEETGTVPAIAGTPARSGCPERKRR